MINLNSNELKIDQHNIHCFLLVVAPRVRRPPSSSS